mgnify:CR=1 FL=1
MLAGSDGELAYGQQELTGFPPAYRCHLDAFAPTEGKAEVAFDGFRHEFVALRRKGNALGAGGLRNVGPHKLLVLHGSNDQPS